MRIYSLIIANEDKAYSERLKNYICERESGRIRFIGSFDDVESFKSRVERRRSDILLVSSRMHEAIKKDAALNNFKTVVLLRDDMNEDVVEHEGAGNISKYLPADRIITEIINIHEKEHPTEKMGTGDCRIIGFYSVAAGSGKTISAISAAYTLAEEGNRVLYLNLEDIPSTELYFKCEKKNGMANVLMSIGKQDRNLFLDKLEENAEKECGGNLYYISPCEYIVDTTYVEADEWEFLFSALRGGNKFYYVVVDFSSKFDDKIMAQLSLCDRIIFLSSSEKLAKLREESLFKMLEHGAGVDLYTENIFKVKNESAGAINKDSRGMREIVKLIKSIDKK